MNCTEVEKLVPLYVEGDVSEREARGLRAHLLSCAGCSQLAEEFRRSQERLHAFAVPEFGAEVYEQIRAAVLAEINSQRAVAVKPSLLLRLRPQFGWRPALAASLALLLVCSGLFALYRSRQTNAPALAALEKGLGELNPVEIKEATPKIRTAAPSPGDAVKRGARRRTTPEREIESDAPAVARRETRTEGPGATGPPQQAIARMEIQTGDPNIRIIWLARKSGE